VSLWSCSAAHTTRHLHHASTRLVSTAPPSPPHAPARLPLHCAYLSTVPPACLLHRSDLLRPSPPNLPQPSPPKRRAPRHRDANAGQRGTWLPSPSRATAASPPRCGAAAYKRRRAATSGTPTSFHSPKRREDVALKAHVVCFKCFRCFTCTLQVFYTNVAKVDRGCYICCNGCTCMLQVFVPNVLSMFSNVCCKCV
jgi:hypothetical protein